MNVSSEDLRAAVARGIVTEAQSAQLIALAAGRQSARSGVAAIEEPFVLFKGFNEIFVVVGLAILFSGWVGVATLMGLNTQAPAGFTTILLSGLTIAGLMATGSYFTLRRRMIAPSMALQIMTVLAATVFATALIGTGAGDYSVAVIAAVVALIMAGQYALFRVPFTAAIIAAAVFVGLWTALIGAGLVQSSGLGLFGGHTDPLMSVLTIVFGLVTFAVAMRLDLSDPMRISTRSTTAFWLHVVAAPAIVNTVALNLLNNGEAVAQGLLLAFLLIIAVVAIVIDRRSFLVSGAGYSVALAATLFSGAVAIAVLILGLVLVLLGAQWDRLRTRLMVALPDFPGKAGLPPYGATA